MGVTIAELCAAAAGPVADWNVPAEEGCTVLYQAALLLNTASVDEAAQIKAAIRGALRAGAKLLPPLNVQTACVPRVETAYIARSAGHPAVLQSNPPVQSDLTANPMATLVETQPAANHSHTESEPVSRRPTEFLSLKDVDEESATEDEFEDAIEPATSLVNDTDVPANQPAPDISTPRGNESAEGSLAASDRRASPSIPLSTADPPANTSLDPANAAPTAAPTWTTLPSTAHPQGTTPTPSHQTPTAPRVTAARQQDASGTERAPLQTAQHNVEPEEDVRKQRRGTLTAAQSAAVMQRQDAQQRSTKPAKSGMVFSGWAVKEGSSFRTWRRRYFVLRVALTAEVYADGRTHTLLWYKTIQQYTAGAVAAGSVPIYRGRTLANIAPNKKRSAPTMVVRTPDTNIRELYFEPEHPIDDWMLAVATLETPPRRI
eukprot:m.102074 g.102074  ORF g.102074 m.102074 type:complete len:432 (+) comp12527_c0_seq4:50-1345(+)